MLIEEKLEQNYLPYSLQVLLSDGEIKSKNFKDEEISFDKKSSYSTNSSSFSSKDSGFNYSRKNSENENFELYEEPKEKKNKTVIFPENFVKVIDVESYKCYNSSRNNNPSPSSKKNNEFDDACFIY